MDGVFKCSFEHRWEDQQYDIDTGVITKMRKTTKSEAIKSDT